MRTRTFFNFEGTPQARNAHNASLIFLLASLLSLPVYAFVAYQSEVWQGWFLVVLTIMLALAGGGGMLLSRRNKTVEAMGLMIATIIAGGWIGSLLIAGLGTLMAVLIPVVSIIFATQAFPRRWLNRTLLLVGFAGVIAATIGLVGIGWQAQLPALQGVAVPILAAGAIIGFGFIIVRQFARYPFSTKLLMLFLVIVLVAVSAVAATATWMLRNLTTPEEAERTIVFVSLAVVLAAGFLSSLAARSLTNPVENLTNISGRVASGDLSARAPVETDDEIGELASTFNNMTVRLHETLDGLEERVAERTHGLELAAEVGRTISQVRDLDAMLTDAVELIRKQFDLYYSQVYLLNPGKTHLFLQAGTGDVGKELLARAHRIPLDTTSINGRAASEKKAVIIADTAASPTFLPNPLLPNTHSEVAVPLLFGEDTLGVLDMQSEKAGTLSRDMLPAFEALAGQLAVAIQNANLLAEAERARAEVEDQARRLSHVNWSEYLDAIHMPEKTGFVFDGSEVAPQTEGLQPSENAVVAPVAVTGETLGSLAVELEGGQASARAGELINTVARQVAQHLESLRLLETAERYRIEAEEASHRITREGWKAFAGKAGNTLAYMYDLKEVHPLDRALPETANASVPLKVRDEVVGELAVQGLDANNMEGLELAGAVAERLSAHIESLRQFDETQSALAQSEKLFEASRRLTQAANLQDLTATAVDALNVPVVNRAIMTSFTYNAEGELEGLDVIANWWNGTGTPATAIGTHYTAETVRMIPMFVSATPLFFGDAFEDARVDATTSQLVKRLNLRSVAILPLHVGSQQLGVLMMEGDEPHNFIPEEVRLFTALGPQIATVLENRRQFERAQKQAEREAMVNAISQKIQGATSVEAVLQIAARELGHALGAPLTIAQLGMKDRANGG